MIVTFSGRWAHAKNCCISIFADFIVRSPYMRTKAGASSPEPALSNGHWSLPGVKFHSLCKYELILRSDYARPVFSSIIFFH